MQGEPWAYDKHLVVFQRIEDDEAIAEVEFKYTSFWVQLHGIPIRRMNHEAATILGSSLGKIAHVSEGGEAVGGGQAMRIQNQDSLRMEDQQFGACCTPKHYHHHLPSPQYHLPKLLNRYQHPPPIHEDHAIQMDMEESLVNTPLLPQQIRLDDHFESQLRDIDSALNYYHPTTETITKLLDKENATTMLETPSARTPPRAMNCLAWNCRGLGNPRTVQELARLVRAQDLSVVFLIETWQDEGPLERLRCQLQFENKFVANSRNKGGGLCLLWKKCVNIRVHSFSPSHIDAVVDEASDNAWRFTGFYGAPETHKREESWTLLRQLNSQNTLPWCCMGDFNELVRLEKKQGRHTRSERQMQMFRDVLDECGFVDLGFTGPKFTWTNNRVGDMTWERLDKAVATPEWLLCFPSTRVHHLDVRWSDHKPLWVSTEPMMRPSRKLFKFEEVWTSDQGCEDVITTAWKKPVPGVPMFSVWGKIHACRRELRVWSKQSFGNIKTKIQAVEKRLKQAETVSMQGGEHHPVVLLKRELHSLLAKEERLWRQRSRAEWLKAGDRNTRYFHCRATQRQRRNHVYRLKSPTGLWTTNSAQVPALFIDYYNSLFQTENPGQIEQVVEHILPVVTEGMNEELCREFTSGEVAVALKQMAPLKAPGPDGLPPLFYHKYWHLIGDEVTKAVLTCLNTGKILQATNHTYITLIPKIQNPEAVVDFRPISLCNVIYKLISKVLANRLKIILPTIVSESQSAFVPGRLITDNILVAFETLHHMQHQRTARRCSMALKLDMSKAYDKVEWKYLQRVMEQMGFNSKWVTLMMECISSVSYSILVNGEPHGYIKPSRGLRQGDPLSPYLFLLCAEGFHSLLQKEKIAGDLKGVSISRGGPKITHLFFADDSLLFCRATTGDVNRIQGILTQYENASGQQINRQKTTIFFSKSTPHSAKSAIQNMLGVPVIKQYERYLGLPSFIGRAKYSSFAQIKERVWSKLKGWKEKLISQAGREILIKSVAQAIPAYAMSCFRLPNRLIKEIEVLIRRFWWGQNGDKGKMHWLPWNTLCKSKANGGIGFRELGSFNEALLAKQVWRLLHNSSSLFYKVFKSKYFPRCSILEAQLSSTSSYAWKSIMSARDLIKKGSIWRVGSGSNIQIWGDRWLPAPHHHSITSPRCTNQSISQVAHLIDPQSRTWKEELIREIFLPHDAAAILGVPLSLRHQNDSLVWGGTKNGVYAVRSGYHFLMTEKTQANAGPSDTTQLSQLWNTIWSLQIPPKVRHFLWRACHESLPTRNNLHHRHILDDPRCANCSNQRETALHALWQCKAIKKAWQTFSWGRRLYETPYLDFLDLLHRCTQILSPTELQLFSMVSWLIWYHRNRLRLQQPTDPITQIAPQAQQLLTEFANGQEQLPMPLIQPRSPEAIKWQPPTPGRYKVNYDGAIFSNTNEAGLGVIIRNDQGEVMGSLCQRIPFPHSVEAVEASAARYAIQFAKDLGIMKIDLEGDSKIIVDALLLAGPCSTIYGHIIEDIKQIAKVFSSVQFKHRERKRGVLRETEETSSHAGTAVPLSPLYRPISVPLAATGRLRDNLPQRIHRQARFLGFDSIGLFLLMGPVRGFRKRKKTEKKHEENASASGSPEGRASRLDESKLYIFLELVTKGSLAMLYRKVIKAFSSVICNVFTCDPHVLWDIKCANILVDANGSVKLADFGLAKATKLNDVKSCKGTAFWMAPEVVNRKNHGYGLPADIWSLGCTVLEMLTREIPYSDWECMQALFKIGKGEPPPVPESLSKDARDFILQCLQANPDARPTAAQLLDHPFVKRPLPTFSGSASPRNLGRRRNILLR
uniref:Protein kinase domain-containing protein n=1 Tax=Fagus sylvatica TaxID=28930 RepID=A0A2N9FN80_FAGSY